MNSFKKALGLGVAVTVFSFLAMVSFVPKSRATFSNPVMDQSSYRQNANYIRVFNEDYVSHAAGSVMIYVLPAAATYAGVSVSSTTSASLGRVAGVVPYGETIASRGWGRLQVYGYHPAVKIAVANAATDELITSTTAGSAGVYSSGAEHGIVFGTALEATVSSTTVKALLKIE